MYRAKVFTGMIKICMGLSKVCMGLSKVCIRLSKVCMWLSKVRIGLNNINASKFFWASDKTTFDGVRHFDRLLSCLTN